MSPGGPPPLQAEDTSPSVAMACVGLVIVCVAMTVVMGGSLEVAVLLLGQVRVGMDSASFSSCPSLFSSSLVGILMSMLSGGPSLLLSSMLLWLDSALSMGPHSLQSVTSESEMLSSYSSVGSLLDSQQLFCMLYLTRYQKQLAKSNSTGKYMPLKCTKYPVSPPTVVYVAALRYLFGIFQSPLQLRGKPFLNTFSALDTTSRFNLMS